MEDCGEDANADLETSESSQNIDDIGLPEKRRKIVNKKKTDMVDDKLLEILSQAPSRQKEHDEVDLFLLSLAPQMRRLGQRHQAAAKVQMVTLLSNLELQEYRPPNPTPSPLVSNYFEGGSSPWESQGHYAQHFKSVRSWEHFED